MFGQNLNFFPPYPKEKLRSRHLNCFSLPKKEISDLPDIPILIDANDSETMAQLETVAHSISSNVAKAGDDERMKLHIAAVFCNNFVNHLYFLAEEYCKGEGIDFELLKPLIIETAERLNQANPSDSQTGPAIRKDESTITKHKELLSKYPQLLKIYTILTESIKESR